MLDLLFFFDGRLGRGRYFAGSMVLWPLATILAFVGFAAIWTSDYRDSDTAKFLVLGGVGVLFFWVGFALGVKRCHDMDRSGWLYFWSVFVPGVLTLPLWIGLHDQPLLGGALGPVALVGWINLVLAPGTDGPNKYGYPPSP